MIKRTLYIRLFIMALLAFATETAIAQAPDGTVWTLDRCIEYALEHNIELQSERLAVQEQNIFLSDSRWAFVPRISASSGYNLSMGRVLDETTYDFVTNEMVGSSSSSVSASIPIFSGLRNIRQLQLADIGKKNAELQVEKASNDLKLNITAYFLEVLCAKENIANCSSLVESLHQQEKHIGKKVEMGKTTYADLLQVRSRLAEAENTLLSAIHAYDVSRLNICQLLEIEDYSSFIPCTDEYENISYKEGGFLWIMENTPNLPQVRMAENNVEMSRKNIQIAKASYYPSLSLNAGYGTSYSSARRKIIGNADDSYDYEPYPFFEQYRDNASGYVSLGLTIPILHNMSARNGVRRAKIELQKSEYALETTRKQLHKEVLQAVLDAETAWKKYSGSVSYLESAEEAFRQISIKYDNGAANMTEYTTAISAMSEAQYQYLVSKYEYIFKVRILDFYKNY